MLPVNMDAAGPCKEVAGRVLNADSVLRMHGIRGWQQARAFAIDRCAGISQWRHVKDATLQL